jgi:hypothetical protein
MAASMARSVAGLLETGFGALPPEAGALRMGFIKFTLSKSPTPISRKPSPSRKMFRQQFTGFADAVGDAFRELGFAKMAGHGLRQFLPKKTSPHIV